MSLIQAQRAQRRRQMRFLFFMMLAPLPAPRYAVCRFARKIFRPSAAPGMIFTIAFLPLFFHELADGDAFFADAARRRKHSRYAAAALLSSRCYHDAFQQSVIDDADTLRLLPIFCRSRCRCLSDIFRLRALSFSLRRRLAPPPRRLPPKILASSRFRR